MAVIKPFNTTTVTRVATQASTQSNLSSALSFVTAPSSLGTIFVQRIYGVTVNITDDGVETLDVLTTVNET